MQQQQSSSVGGAGGAGCASSAPRDPATMLPPLACQRFELPIYTRQLPIRAHAPYTPRDTFAHRWGENCISGCRYSGRPGTSRSRLLLSLRRASSIFISLMSRVRSAGGPGYRSIMEIPRIAEASERPTRKNIQRGELALCYFEPELFGSLRLQHFPSRNTRRALKVGDAQMSSSFYNGWNILL